MRPRRRAAARTRLRPRTRRRPRTSTPRPWFRSRTTAASRRDAWRAAAVAIPAYVAACAVPDGGLFRAARFRDVHLYQGFAHSVFDGAVPYRDFFMEYPPGALAVFLPPELFGSAHYNAAFKILMALCGAATIALVALLLVRLGANRARLYTGLGLLPPPPLPPRALSPRARTDLAQHLRRVACAADARCFARLSPRQLCAARPRVRGEGLSARAAAAGADVCLAHSGAARRCACRRRVRGRCRRCRRSVPDPRTARPDRELSRAGRPLAAGREPRRIPPRCRGPSRPVHRHRRAPNTPHDLLRPRGLAPPCARRRQHRGAGAVGAARLVVVRARPRRSGSRAACIRCGDRRVPRVHPVLLPAI